MQKPSAIYCRSRAFPSIRTAVRRTVDAGLATMPGGSGHRRQLLADIIGAAAKEMPVPPGRRWPPDQVGTLASSLGFVLLHFAHRSAAGSAPRSVTYLAALSRVLTAFEGVVCSEVQLPWRLVEELARAADGLLITVVVKGGDRKLLESE